MHPRNREAEWIISCSVLGLVMRIHQIMIVSGVKFWLPAMMSMAEQLARFSQPYIRALGD
ncbi:hypothetical protein BT63DRAFT_96156 [Microthyrium microscopicum]|uniref:Uncharacterized protein n=1 Tax=Microthyrium microscopicum TaxID=703497 RepID=A0A6A6U0Q9_9PEZI|nr:hypothetical protein BT63DRAFT_96156 [Microthyrium microscopicum]